MSEKNQKKTQKNKKPKKDAIKPLSPEFAKINAIATGSVFAAVAVALAVLPRSEESLIEQRKLAEMPEFSWESFVNGEYTNGITEFYDDTVPYRDDLKRVSASLKNLFGVRLEGAEVHGQLVAVTEDDDEEDTPQTTPAQTTTVTTTSVSDAGTTAEQNQTDVTSAAVTTTATTTAPAATTTVTSERQVNEVAEGVITNGQVVAKLDDGHYWAISLFGGGKGAAYADALNRFRSALPESVNIYSMVAPTSGEYYLPSNFAEYNASHAKSVQSINSRLSEGITPVDAISALAAHTDEPIFTRTDHHWQPLGAYYAAQAFAKAADVPFTDISEMKKVVVDGFVGTMYGYTESASLLNDPEQFVYYKPQNDYTTYYYDTAYNFDYTFPFFIDMPVGSSYSTFMGGDKKIVRIETDVDNGRKLLIFKDSYGNAEVPFYFGSFEEIYVCDMRYFDLNAVQFIEEKGITDLLFTMCTFSAVGTNANGLNTALDNPTVEHIPEN